VRCVCLRTKCNIRWEFIEKSNIYTYSFAGSRYHNGVFFFVEFCVPSMRTLGLSLCVFFVGCSSTVYITTPLGSLLAPLYPGFTPLRAQPTRNLIRGRKTFSPEKDVGMVEQSVTSDWRLNISVGSLLHLISCNTPNIGFRRITFFFNLCGGTLGTVATTGLLYQPRMIGEGDCGEIGGMKIGRGDWSTRRKRTPTPLCPPQIPHD
jgi:hypothetical protein